MTRFAVATETMTSKMLPWITGKSSDLIALKDQVAQAGIGEDGFGDQRPADDLAE